MDVTYSVENTSGVDNVTWVDHSWYKRDYGGVPPIYAITLFHLYPIVMLGRVVHILWYTIGVIGNIISMRIWTQSHMKKLNSSALYLVSITFCDIGYHVLHVFFYLKYYWGLESVGVTGICQLWNILNLIPQYASQLLVLGFTTERLISIVRPFQGERFSKHKRAPKVIIIIATLVVTLTLPQGLFWEVDGDGFCEISLQYIDFYEIWSYMTESFIFVIVPVTSLIMNIIVLAQTSRTLKQRSQLSSNDRHSQIHKNGKARKPAIKTLLSISFFRILTQLPISIMYTIHNFDVFSFGALMPLAEMTHDPQKIAFIRYWGCRMIIEIFGASHHALSVFIFYASTKQFRCEVKQLMHICKVRVIRRNYSFSPDSPSDTRLTTFFKTNS
ncbi:uncharacterized protein LOC128225966 [Mya arenaria]|uniref:uncharacterized protein LOC128225966 n=1 Tax=Mya arenaria TaxID=6604 RepID=UPI0022E5680A|nr:uncharacterized protein LOC128225966 [Mya arenaria]